MLCRVFLLSLLWALLGGCAVGPRQTPAPSTDVDWADAERRGAAVELSMSATEQVLEDSFAALSVLQQRVRTAQGEGRALIDDTTVVADWLTLRARADEASSAQPDDRRSWRLAAATYALGASLAQVGAADRAAVAVGECLKRFPNDVDCHLLALDIFLTHSPPDLERAEASMTRLRQQYGDGQLELIERGQVFLLLYHQQYPAARVHIERFLDWFPNSVHAPWMRAAREALGESEDGDVVM